MPGAFLVHPRSFSFLMLGAQRVGVPIPRAPQALASQSSACEGTRGRQNAQLHSTQHGDILLRAVPCRVLGTEGPCQALLPIPHPSLPPSCPCSSSESPAHC